MEILDFVITLELNREDIAELITELNGITDTVKGNYLKKLEEMLCEASPHHYPHG